MIAIKDFLALLFSAIALVASIVTTYYSLREKNDVQARIVEFYVDNNKDKSQEQITTHVAFINRGNQPVLITGAEFVAMPRLDMSDGSFAGPICSRGNDFPFVLNSGQMKLVVLEQPLSYVESNAKMGSSLLHYGLRFASVDSKGNEQGVEVIFASISFDNQDAVSQSGKHASVQLRGNSEIAFRIDASDCSILPSRQ